MPVSMINAISEAPSDPYAWCGVDDALKFPLPSDHPIVSVRLDDGTGYRFASEESFVDTRTGDVTGETLMNGEGPSGQVQSQAYSVYDKGDRIVFRGGVRARFERQ